ncbi:MAG TPA: glycosyltransferase family 4 protein [Elusimicrobiota bacterium]|nr:glycosyltransferase family 4 protein [Elusimicrobiota bacterium]
MKNIIFVGSHLGYPMDRTPLGGGAMVGLQLARHWKPDAGWRLVVLGSGPEAPAQAAQYVRLAARPDGLVELGELAYARFCADFEAETTQWILDRQREFRPMDTAIVVNDISEGPTLGRLTRAGYRVLSIWHVDVVDYFNKLYLRRFLAPERLTRVHEKLKAAGVEWILPQVLNLVFDKQRETVVHSTRIVVPSTAMTDTIRRCYGDLIGEEELSRRVQVIPWGVWAEDPSQAEINRADDLRDYHEIGPDTFTLMTLSRISPEKGIHLLLEALRLLEAGGKLAGKDVRLFVCGEPAFMMGQAYHKKVKAAAARLKQVKVYFPGYLDAASKRIYLRLPNVFVSPSVHESYGLNVVEAMHAGLPVLASDHYGVRDMLPPEAGRLVHYPSTKKAPARLAEAILELMNDRAKLEEMGKAARAAAEALPFSAAAEAVRLAALGMLS